MKGLLVALMVFMSATAARAEIYTWKDSTGTRFYTNSLNEIPTRFLKKARVLDVATGKLGGLATAQPATPVTAARPPAPTPMTQPLLVSQDPAVQPAAAPEQQAPVQLAAPRAATAPAAAAPPAAAPVVEPARAAQNSTRPAGRLSRKELRAKAWRSNSTGEE
ncbi:DUF4124 domain-containing protein [Geomonas propionica]|uniref:DUF4124 domain-containing protein n=1 Tax=Geomonas propionica TaxID=2798582 RepID=A0ABS0YVS3_9BACT|nr:DUF4124 domain-containing protein [Geomonas propionica]MBJ6802029.1 hypothetical protein [Geomonas propionica]